MNIASSLRVACRGAALVSRQSTFKHVSMASTRVFTKRAYSTEPVNGNVKGEKKPENATPPPPTESEDKKLIEKLKKDLEDAKHETLLAVADRQNSIRIAKEDVRKAKEYGIQNFAKSLFDVNDILERALELALKTESVTSNEDFKTFVEGVQMTEKQLFKTYEQYEVKRFNPLGQKFDPNLHQALQEIVDPSKEAGTVCYVMKSGYMLKDRLLRPAAVVVVKAEQK